MVLGGHKEVQKMVLGCSKNSLEAPKSGRRGSKNGLKPFKKWSKGVLKMVGKSSKNGLFIKVVGPPPYLGPACTGVHRLKAAKTLATENATSTSEQIASSCQKLPQFATSCQKLPQVVKSCHKLRCILVKK